MLVVLSETVGPFDDVISARVFGLPDSEMCAGTGQHSKDKATRNIHNFGVGNSAYSRIFAQESGENKGVQATNVSHATSALPTFTLSGRQISHSMK